MTKLSDIEPSIWFADTEVFEYDNIWVFTKYGTGVTEVFVNDNKGVRAFIKREHPILCGYNFRDYDQYILKACLHDFAQADIKYVNDVIITGGDDKFDIIWDMFDGVYGDQMPAIIDLFHDIVPRRSLKMIEGHLGMSVKESTVPFDIDRPLSESELEESVEYCKYDVYATSKLYELRREYLQSKITLCEICGEDFMPMLKHSNARILAEVFHAKPYDFDVSERYEIPKEVDLSGIPADVLDYVAKCDCKVATGEVDAGKLEFDFHGVPSVFGIGGIHSADAVPYIEETTDDRVILIQDITSYYPSIILEYGYTSRAAAPECKDLYERFYHMRVEAKARGDKETANAAKLVLNTYSGAMGGKFNKLYDPMMPLGLRLTGQLAIMDAVNCAMRDAPSARFIQLNTDGWVLSVNREELDSVLAGVKEWEERTRFSVDTQFVKKLVQRDVNNYILEKPDGSVKVKGGTVSLYHSGGFKSNSVGVCHDAIVDLLLYGTPIRETVYGCEDMERFQLVAKAGSSFDYTVWVTDATAEGPDREKPCVKLHLCNRIFASNDKRDGMVYKVKHVVDGCDKWSKVPNCPEHARVVNGDLGDGIPDWLDKDWYVAYATTKALSFVEGAIGYGGQKMAEEIVETLKEDVAAETPKRKRSVKNAAKEEVKQSLVEQMIAREPENLDEALFKLQLLMSGNSNSVKFDGYISNINYSYADTQQYKQVLAKCCLDCGLVFSMDVNPTVLSDDGEPISMAASQCFMQRWEEFDRVLNGPKTADEAGVKRSKFLAYCVDVEMTLTFVPTRESRKFHTVGYGVGTQGNAVSIAVTNAMRNFITNNFLIDNKGRDGDDVAAANLESLRDNAESKFVSPEKKSEIREGIVSEKKVEAKHATTTYAKALYAKLKAAIDADAEFAANQSVVKALKAGYEDDGTPRTIEGDPDHSVLKQAGAAKLYRMAEAVVG